jgi:hypothetical protein
MHLLLPATERTRLTANKTLVTMLITIGLPKLHHRHLQTMEAPAHHQAMTTEIPLWGVERSER